MSNHRCEIQLKIHLNHECFHTITQESYKFFKKCSKIHEKEYKFPYSYSKDIDIYKKTIVKYYMNKFTIKKVKIFHNI